MASDEASWVIEIGENVFHYMVNLLGPRVSNPEIELHLGEQIIALSKISSEKRRPGVPSGSPQWKIRGWNLGLRSEGD